jgi:PAS domain S-box-containing protein
LKKNPNSLILLTTFLLFSIPVMVTGQAPDTTKILLLNSYHQGYEWTDLLTQSIRQELGQLDRIWQLAIEYMDTKHYNSAEYESMLYQLYLYKYRNKKFDVLIISDNYALDFIKKYRRELFGQTPIVFCGIDNFVNGMLDGLSNCTGVIEDYDLQQTIDLMLKLHPEAKHIAVVSDSSVIGRKDLARALKLIPNYQNRVEFVIIKNWDLQKLPAVLAALPKHTLILRLAFSRTWDGTSISVEEAAGFWENCCNRPTYTSLGHPVEHGILGGIINTADLHGKAVGQLALQILRNVPADKIPIIYQSPSATIFDYTQLKKIGIKSSALPGSALIINRPFSFYREYKYLVWGVVSAFCLLGSLIFFLILNILSRKQAQDALRENEQKYRVLIETLPNGIVEVDLLGNITFANSAFQHIFRYSDAKLEGSTVYDFVPKARRKKIRGIITALFQEAPKPMTIIDKYLTQENRIIDIQLDWNYKRNFSGKIIGIISVVSDITQRLQAEKEAKIRQEQLIQADKMAALGTLVSGVAHEINNPNNFIMLNVPTLNRTWNSILPILDQYYETTGDFEVPGYTFSQIRDEFPKICSDILEGSRRIQIIVKDLKEYSQKSEIEYLEPVNINEMLGSCINLLSKNIQKYTQNFQIEYAPNLPLVLGNFQRFEQVVINLIQNACHALRSRNEKISIIARHDPSEKTVTISIQDEGIGIPPQNLPRIFDPFFTTKRESGGTGLGLSVSNSIIRKYGGSLKFTSEPGQGTTARIILPVNFNPKKERRR